MNLVFAKLECDTGILLDAGVCNLSGSYRPKDGPSFVAIGRPLPTHFLPFRAALRIVVSECPRLVDSRQAGLRRRCWEEDIRNVRQLT